MPEGEGTRQAQAEKRALRAELIALRASITQEDRARKSAAIAARLDDVPALRAARVVALYAPLGTEVDVAEVDRRLAGRDVRVVWPRSLVGERRLVFCRSEFGALVRGPLGAREPPEGSPEVDVADIECVVMPGVAFSIDGHRLGRGGGYYDATLRSMKNAARIGVAYDTQVVPALPREPHDAALDAIVTDLRTLVFPRDREGR